MEKVKSYTDLEQSKKLAEILPVESADMAWCNNFIGIDHSDKYSAHLYTAKEMKEVFDKYLVGWDKYWKLIPCWSLAALLNVLPPYYQLQTQDDGIGILCSYKGNTIIVAANSSVDACVDMIIKLHEQNIL